MPVLAGAKEVIGGGPAREGPDGPLAYAVVGALLVNYAKTTFTTGALAPYWLFVLGGLFVAVTLLLPRGIVGTLAHFWGERGRRWGGNGAGAHPNTVRSPSISVVNGLMPFAFPEVKRGGPEAAPHDGTYDQENLAPSRISLGVWRSTGLP